MAPEQGLITMMDAKKLADLIEAIPIEDDVIEIGLLTPQQRDLIVDALRAMPSLDSERAAPDYLRELNASLLATRRPRLVKDPN